MNNINFLPQQPISSGTGLSSFIIKSIESFGTGLSSFIIQSIESIDWVRAVNGASALFLSEKICKIASKQMPSLAPSIDYCKPGIFFVCTALACCIPQPIFWGIWIAHLWINSCFPEPSFLDRLLGLKDQPSKNGLPQGLSDLSEESKTNPYPLQESSLHYILAIEKALSLGLLTSVVLLLAAPGAGKTYTIKQIATLTNDKKSSYFYGKKILSLNMSSFMSGTKYLGELEKKVDQVTSYLKKQKNAILFIDEAHTLKGTGTTQGKSSDLLDLLKPLTDLPLNQGGLALILATTFKESQELQKDKAFWRRCRRIEMQERTKEELVQMSKSEIHRLLEKHEFPFVSFDDQTIEWVVSLVLKTPFSDDLSLEEGERKNLQQIGKQLLSSLGDDKEVAPNFKTLRLLELLFQNLYKENNSKLPIDLKKILTLKGPGITSDSLNTEASHNCLT